MVGNNLGRTRGECNLLEDPEKRSQRSPRCPDSSTSPSLTGKNNGSPKISTSISAPQVSPELISKAQEAPNNPSCPAWKENSNMEINTSARDTEIQTGKIKFPNLFSINSGHHLNENNPYSTLATSNAQILSAGIPSMAVHTSPVALHLLSSYIAAGFVPQIPGNNTLLSARTGFESVNPTANLQNTPGIGFQSVASLMTSSAASNTLHSQPISTGSLEKITSPSSLTTQDFGIPMNPNINMSTHNGFSLNSALNMNLSGSGIKTNDVRSSGTNNNNSNDIKRPVPHLPPKSSGIGIL